MWQRATTGASGGGDTIPFTLNVVSSRVTINSQNCYIFNDGGTIKVHYEFNVTATATISDAGILVGVIPYNANSNMDATGVFPNSWKVMATNSGTRLSLYGNITSGTTYTMNQDVATDWNA